MALGNGADKCGFRQYTISSVPNSGTAAALSALELTIDVTSGLIKLHATNSETVGTHTATVTASLRDHSSVVSQSVCFEITIEACKVTVFTMRPLDPYFYTIGDPVGTWSITAD